MREEQDYRELASAVRSTAPAPADKDTLDRVRSEARQRADRMADGTGTGAFRPVWQYGLAAALVIAAVVIGLRVGPKDPELTMAFAKQDAIAALVPAPGNVLHLKTREWAQNAGESKPIIAGNEYQESWTDFQGKRGHTYWRAAADDTVISEAVVADGRSRLKINPIGLDPGMTPLTEGPAPDDIIGSELYVYEYIREWLPEGEVVGEVVIDGERYWDMRWNDVRDRAGNKLDARALFRQPDYRPLRIERDYSGDKSAWEVLEWEVVPLAQVDLSMFELGSVVNDGVLEERIYLLGEVPSFKEFEVAWLGREFEGRTAERQENLVDKGDHTETELGEPMFWYRWRGSADGDPLVDGPRLSMDYRSGKLPNVKVISLPSIPTEQLKTLIAQKTEWTDVEAIRIPMGPGVVARSSDEGTVTAIVSAPGATVMVESRNEAALFAALKALRKAE